MIEEDDYDGDVVQRKKRDAQNGMWSYVRLLTSQLGRLRLILVA